MKPLGNISHFSILCAAMLSCMSCDRNRDPDFQAGVTFSTTAGGACVQGQDGVWYCSADDGDGLTLSLTANVTSFVLEEWSCDISCASVSPEPEKGRTYCPDAGKPWTVAWSKMDGGDYTLDFTVLDRKSSQRRAFSAKVSVRRPFTVGVSLSGKVIEDGDDVTVRVTTDREALRLVGCDWPFNASAAAPSDALTEGTDYEFTQTDAGSGLKYRDFIFKDISVENDAEKAGLNLLWADRSGSAERRCSARETYAALTAMTLSAALGMPENGLRGYPVQDGVIERGELAVLELHCTRKGCRVSNLSSSTGAVWFTSPAEEGEGALADGEVIGFCGDGGSAVFETVLKDSDIPAGGPEGYAGTLSFTLTDTLSGTARDLVLQYNAKDHVPVGPEHLYADNPTVQGQSIGDDAMTVNPWLNCSQVYGLDLRTLPVGNNGGVTISPDPSGTAVLQYAFTEQGSPCDWEKAGSLEFRNLTGEVSVGKATSEGNVQGLWLRATDHAGQAVLNITSNIPGSGGRTVTKTIRLRITQRLAIVYDGYCRNVICKYVFKDTTSGDLDPDPRITDPGISEYFPIEKGPFGWYGVPVQTAVYCTYGHDDGVPAADDPFESVQMNADGVPVRDLGDIALTEFSIPPEDLDKEFSISEKIKLEGVRTDFAYSFYYAQKGWPYRLLLWDDGDTGLDKVPITPHYNTEGSATHNIDKLSHTYGSAAFIPHRIIDYADCYRGMKEDGSCMEHLTSDLHIVLNYGDPVFPEGYEVKYVIFANGLMKGGKRFHIPGLYPDSHHIEQYDAIFPYYFTDPGFNWLHPVK